MDVLLARGALALLPTRFQLARITPMFFRFFRPAFLLASSPPRVQLSPLFMPSPAVIQNDRDNCVGASSPSMPKRSRKIALPCSRSSAPALAPTTRAEHLPTFDRELQLLKANNIRLEAVWFPAQLDADARKILDLLRKHHLKTQLWITMADPAPGKAQADKVAAAVKILKPIALEAARQNCSVGLYNHGNWFGEPENELAIIDAIELPTRPV